MKSLLRIERVAVIRWSTLAFVAVLLFPLFFLRYGNTGAVVQSAMVMALPVTAAGLVFSNARVPSSYRSFSIHDRLLLRFSVKSLSLGVVINVCLRSPPSSFPWHASFCDSGSVLSSPGTSSPSSSSPDLR